MDRLAPSQWSAAVDPTTHLLDVGGAAEWVQNAGRPWSLTNPGGDNTTLRFELHPGDLWPVDATERSEIAGETRYGMGTNIHVSYAFNLEPGAPNHAKWLAIGQFHEASNDGWQQPFGVFLSGEKMAIVIADAGEAPNDWSKYQVIYADSGDIVRGHTYQMQIDVNFDLVSGSVHVVRDGASLVDYHGPLGWQGMDSVYWKEGLYREASDTVVAAEFSQLSITTDAQPPPPPPTDPAAPGVPPGDGGLGWTPQTLSDLQNGNFVFDVGSVNWGFV